MKSEASEFNGHIDPAALGSIGEIPSEVVAAGMKNSIHAAVANCQTPLHKTDAKNLGHRFCGTPSPSTHYSDAELLQFIGQNRFSAAFWRIHHMHLAEKYMVRFEERRALARENRKLRKQLAESERLRSLKPEVKKPQRKQRKQRTRRPTVDPFLG